MPISKTDMAILGMLTIEPMSGYDMKQFCEQSLSHFWHESYGNLYPRLGRLSDAGLVRARRESRPRGPDAVVYSLTARGRTRFRTWLQEPPEPERVRSELMLKFFFGAQAEPELGVSMLEAYMIEQLAMREQYRAIEKMLRTGSDEQPQVVFWLMSLRRGQLLTEARLRWCRESLEILGGMNEEAQS